MFVKFGVKIVGWLSRA